MEFQNSNFKMDFIFKERNIFYNVLCFLITENEKLFDRCDSKLYWRTVFYLFYIYHHSLVGSYARSIENSLKYSEEETFQTLYKFRAAYLTGWSFTFQTIFLFLAVSHDVLQWTDKHKTAFGLKLRYYRDVIYNAVVVPFTCFVFAMFWGIYAIDRELVFPKVYDDVVPWWFNQCVHTNILSLVVVETFLQARREPTNRRLEVSINAAVGISYAVVFYSIYFFTHRWLYNVFGLLTWWQICIYQTGIWTSCYLFYVIQFPINRLVHGKTSDEKENVEFIGNSLEICRNNAPKSAIMEVKNGNVAL